MAHRSRVFTHCSPPPASTPYLCIYDVENILRTAAQAESMITSPTFAVVGDGAEAGKDIQKCSVRILSLAHRVRQMNRPVHTPSFIHPLPHSCSAAPWQLEPGQDKQNFHCGHRTDDN